MPLLGEIVGACDYEKGDISGDGVVNVLDIVATVQHVLGNNDNISVCGLEAADMNDDGVINILDIVAMVQKRSLGIKDLY